MSFILVPSRLSAPNVPNLSYFDTNTYRGYGMDSRKYAFRTNMGYVISESMAYCLKIGGSIYSPVFSNVNGYIYWKSGNDCIYYSQYYGWIKCAMFPGYEPEEYYDNDKKKYDGDSFWSGSIPIQGGSSTFIPRGSNKTSGSSITVSFYWKRWQATRSEMPGAYTPMEDATGTIYFGLPRWKDGNGGMYIRSVLKTSGIFSYGSIRYVSGKWVIGTINDPYGWWEGNEPSKSSPRTFTFMVPEGSELHGENKIISFKDYVVGEECIEAYLSEVAIWR